VDGTPILGGILKLRCHTVAAQVHFGGQSRYGRLHVRNPEDSAAPAASRSAARSSIGHSESPVAWRATRALL
jgi:hypothetical protein